MIFVAMAEFEVFPHQASRSNPLRESRCFMSHKAKKSDEPRSNAGDGFLLCRDGTWTRAQRQRQSID
jgi:hypothetical protein